MAKKWNIPEEKARKIAVGATVAGVLIVLFLLVVIIVQIVQIAQRVRTARELDEQIAHYEQLIQEKSTDLDFYESEFGMYYQALEQGWRTPEIK